MTEVSSRPTEPPRDRFLLWPLALTIGWPIIAMVASIMPLLYGFLLVLNLAIFWVASATAVLCVALGWLKRRAWRRFASAIAFPALTLIALVNYDTSWQIIRRGGDLIHLWAMIPAYRLEIAELPTDRGPRLRYFSFENGFGSTEVGALYDESDGLAKSSTGRASTERALGCDVTGWLPAGGHFYVAEIAC